MKNLRIVWALILTWGSINLFAQYQPDHYDVDQNTVVAVNGLKLRTKPNLKGKVIGKIPYGQKVDILSEYHYGHDTLQSDYKIFYSGQAEAYEPMLSGYWVKVSHEGQEGYVFSGFLYYHYDTKQLYNKKAALLFEGSNCYDNLHFRPDWHWYGLYEVDGLHLLKKVKLDLFVEESDMGPFLTVATDKNRPSLFIIGSPRPLDERRLLFSDYLGHGTSVYMGGEVDQKLLQKAALEIKEAEGEDRPQIIAVGSRGERQILNPEETYFPYPSNLLWYGDLDGDGKMDYIINYGEKSAQTILYLSSQAKTGQLVKPVGAYFSGYCC